MKDRDGRPALFVKTKGEHIIGNFHLGQPDQLEDKYRLKRKEKENLILDEANDKFHKDERKKLDEQWVKSFETHMKKQIEKAGFTSTSFDTYPSVKDLEKVPTCCGGEKGAAENKHHEQRGSSYIFVENGEIKKNVVSDPGDTGSDHQAVTAEIIYKSDETFNIHGGDFNLAWYNQVHALGKTNKLKDFRYSIRTDKDDSMLGTSFEIFYPSM